MVAEYWTQLPPKRELEQKIHTLLIEAKEWSEQRKRLGNDVPKNKIAVGATT